MWKIPQSLMSSGTDATLTITTQVAIGNLWTYMGSPAGPQNVVVTVDGPNAYAVVVDITADWSGGSTFQFDCINGGSIMGGNAHGGVGGADNGVTGSPGAAGFDGSNAMTCNGFTVNVNIDDGFLCGGGGGGGGGSYTPTGSGGDGGGGGGGGQGGAFEIFGIDTGGGGGNPYSGTPPPADGGNGTLTGPGAGGLGGGPGFSATSSGGAGGKLGSGGQAGRSANISTLNGFRFLAGGVGGRAGKAFLPSNGATIVYNGVKSAATLRSESRIKGEDTTSFVAQDSFRSIHVSVAGASTTGIIFESNGNMTTGNLSGSPITLIDRWLTTTSIATAALYEVRERNLTGDVDGGSIWLFRVHVTPGTWAPLSAAKTQAITSASGIQGASTLLEIRRNDVPGNPDDEIIMSFHLSCNDENNV